MARTYRLHARTGALPAIAAALALSSTLALAQEAQPVPTENAPATPSQPGSAPDEPAPATDSSATAPSTSVTSTPKTTRTKRTIKRTTRVTTAKAAPAATPSTNGTSQIVTRHAAAPAAASAAAATPRPAAAPATPSAQSSVAPGLNFKPQPQPARPASINGLAINPDSVPIAAGGALALLALGGAAAAVTRSRRKRRAQELADAETLSYEPFETTTARDAQPMPPAEETAAAARAAPAFDWRDRPQGSDAAPMEGQDDRRPGETWVERAYRGPTPNNPSVSLRHRLKRAAFFDKREREAAAGTAQPAHARAGLPGARPGARELA